MNAIYDISYESHELETSSLAAVSLKESACYVLDFGIVWSMYCNRHFLSYVGLGIKSWYL